MIGSSGFWELCEFSTKKTVEKFNKVKFKEMMESKKKLDAKEKIEYQFGDVILKDLLNSFIQDEIATEPWDELPPFDSSVGTPVGYQNMSGILIRMRKKALAWIDPAEVKRQEMERKK